KMENDEPTDVDVSDGSNFSLDIEECDARPSTNTELIEAADLARKDLLPTNPKMRYMQQFR
ncbi:hypothetical protein Bhyg_01254, partial [Pseudolycoriella hygida]